MLLSSCQLIHVQTAFSLVLAGHEQMEHGPRAFSRNHAYLGFTCYDGPKIFATASGAELFGSDLHNCNFIDFLRPQHQALVVRNKFLGSFRKGTERSVEIWDFLSKTRLQAVRLDGAFHSGDGDDLPEVWLDTLLLLREPDVRFVQSDGAIAKLRLPWPDISFCCSSPDDCTLVCARWLDEGDAGAGSHMALSLVKLC